MRVRPLDDADRRDIASWRYPGDLAIYDPGEGASRMRAPEHFALVDEADALLAYATFGVEAQVPGGDYEADAVDLGLGLRPSLVGQGLGPACLRALMEFARRDGARVLLRVTVAQQNARAMALIQGMGFERVQTFTRARDGRVFVVATRDA